jgi:peptide/nickel transport system permease protein
MRRLIFRRLAEMLIVLLVLTAVVFLLRQLQPVDPARVALGPRASVGAIEDYRRQLGYDQPLVKQYVDYLVKIAHGDFQTSVRTQRPVSEDLKIAVPATLELAISAFILALLGGLGLGMISASRSRLSGLVRGVMTFGASIPVFLLAYGGILLFARQLGWLPAIGRTSYPDFQGPTGFLTVDSVLAGRLEVFVDALEHLVMPASCIALLSAVSIGRVLRSGLRTSLAAPYARTARAKGLYERQVVLHHGLRNASGPALTMAGLQLGQMFAGIVIVETIFAWPGVGWYMAQSIPTNDFAAIGAVTLLLGGLYVVVNAAVDILQMVADPRIRR